MVIGLWGAAELAQPVWAVFPGELSQPPGHGAAGHLLSCCGGKAISRDKERGESGESNAIFLPKLRWTWGFSWSRTKCCLSSRGSMGPALEQQSLSYDKRSMSRAGGGGGVVRAVGDPDPQHSCKMKRGCGERDWDISAGQERKYPKGFPAGFPAGFVVDTSIW